MAKATEMYCMPQSIIISIIINCSTRPAGRKHIALENRDAVGMSVVLNLLDYHSLLLTGTIIHTWNQMDPGLTSVYLCQKLQMCSL